MVGCLLAKAVIDKITLPVHWDHVFLAGLLGRGEPGHAGAMDRLYTYDR